MIRTTMARHKMIVEQLRALGRLSGVSVILQARLYQVDRAFYDRVAKQRRLFGEDLEKLERQFLAGALKDDAFWKGLKKQPIVLNGEEIKLADSAEAMILSWHKAVSCLPSADQLRKKDGDPQVVFEGVSFSARGRTSPDRRFVRLQFTESSADLRQVSRRTVITERGERTAELPILDRAKFTEALEIPDGGTLLWPVHYRSRELRTKERWWILAITPRIYIKEEEEMLRKAKLDKK